MNVNPYMLVSFDAAEADAAGLAEALEGFGAPPPLSVSARRMGKDRPWRVEALFETAPDAAGLASFLVDIGFAAPYLIEPLADANWIAMSEAGLPAIRTERFFVRGAHVALPEDLGTRRVLTIEAGLAFGTGHHMSTLGCLDELERLLRSGFRPRRILDLGTGTGLLAFAAAHLFKSALILATDIDPVAIDVSRRNARLNGFHTRMRFLTAPGLKHPAIGAGGPFDLIIANILAGPLRRLARDMRPHLARGGRVLLAGLLDEQATAVAAAYRMAAMRFVARRDREGWSTLLIARGD